MKRHIGNLDDLDIEEALNDFLRNALSVESDVAVEFADGVATVRGTVTSLTAEQAIEDLVLAHDGVYSVVSELEFTPAPVRVEEISPRPELRENYRYHGEP